MSIRHKFVLVFLLVAILPVVVGGVFILRQIEGALKDSLLQEVELTLAEKERAVHYHFNQYFREISAITRHPAFTESGSTLPSTDLEADMKWIQDLQKMFSAMIVADPNYYQIRFLDLQGNEIIRVDSLKGGPQAVASESLVNKSDKQYFKNALELDTRDYLISSIEYNKDRIDVYGEPVKVLRVVKPVSVGQHDQRIGFVVLHLLADSFFNDVMGFVENISDFMVVSSDGYVVYNPHGATVGQGYNRSYGYDFSRDQPEFINNFLEFDKKIHHDVTDKEYRVWRKVFFDPSRKDHYWVMLRRITEKELFAPIYIILRDMSLMGAGVIAAIIFIALYVSGSITEPLRRLSKVAHDTAEGDFTQIRNIGLEDRKDEIGDLTSSFTTMTSKLIDERENLERRVEERTAQLKASNTELEQFAYVASHDLQEPLRKIMGFTQLLEENLEGRLDKKTQKYMDYVKDGAGRMKILINDLLQYSRAGRKEMSVEKVKLADLIKRTERLMSAELTGHSLTLKVETLPTVVADPTHLGRVFQNLFSNAVKYNENDEVLIRIYAETSNGVDVICVEDNGIGIPEQYREEVFEVFERLHNKDEYSGTGIGLAVCKRTIERLGGRIWIETPANGLGTVFKFTLNENFKGEYDDASKSDQDSIN